MNTYPIIYLQFVYTNPHICVALLRVSRKGATKFDFSFSSSFRDPNQILPSGQPCANANILKNANCRSCLEKGEVEPSLNIDVKPLVIWAKWLQSKLDSLTDF